MKRFERNKTGKRQYALGQGLQMARACCRACHPEVKIFKRLGQHIVEYAVLITAVSVALSVMYVYAKRGLQGIIKDKVDAEIGPQFESAPLLGTREVQDTIGFSEAVSLDTSRTQRSQTGGMRYTLSSAASATGNSVIVSGQVFVPEDSD